MREGFGELTARAVVLGCGGFEANPEWRARYLGRPWDHAEVRGTRYNTGDGLRMALEIGALPCGQWTGCHSTPIDAEAPPHGDRKLTDKTNRLSYPLRRAGRRQRPALLRRGRGLPVLHLRQAGRHHPQPAAAASRYQIFDAKVTQPPRRAATRRATPVVADSLGGAGASSCRSTAARLRGRSTTTTPRSERGRLRSDRARRPRRPGARAAEVELGAASRHAALHRVAGDRRHHVHLRRRDA